GLGQCGRTTGAIEMDRHSPETDPASSGRRDTRGRPKPRTAGSARHGRSARAAASHKEAAHAIGLARRADGTATLVELLDDPAADVVATALWALGRLRARDCLAAIVARLDDARSEVARAAIWAAAQIGTADAAAALAAYLMAAPASQLKPVLVALDH